MAKDNSIDKQFVSEAFLLSLMMIKIKIPKMLLAIPENTILIFVCPPKFCIRIVFGFSWDHCKSQEKLETMLM